MSFYRKTISLDLSNLVVARSDKQVKRRLTIRTIQWIMNATVKKKQYHHNQHVTFPCHDQTFLFRKSIYIALDAICLNCKLNFHFSIRFLGFSKRYPLRAGLFYGILRKTLVYSIVTKRIICWNELEILTSYGWGSYASKNALWKLV